MFGEKVLFPLIHLPFLSSNQIFHHDSSVLLSLQFSLISETYNFYFIPNTMVHNSILSWLQLLSGVHPPLSHLLSLFLSWWTVLHTKFGSVIYSLPDNKHMDIPSLSPLLSIIWFQTCLFPVPCYRDSIGPSRKLILSSFHHFLCPSLMLAMPSHTADLLALPFLWSHHEAPSSPIFSFLPRVLQCVESRTAWVLSVLLSAQPTTCVSHCLCLF